MLLLSLFLSSRNGTNDWWTRDNQLSPSSQPMVTTPLKPIEEDGTSLTTIDQQSPQSQLTTTTVPPCNICNKVVGTETEVTQVSRVLPPSKSLPEYNLSEVSNHCIESDCWIVIFDHVYNVTKFLNEHPGGEYIMMEFAGRDATIPFRSTRHGKDSYRMLQSYLIGILPENERIYQDFNIENES